MINAFTVIARRSITAVAQSHSSTSWIPPLTTRDYYHSLFPPAKRLAFIGSATRHLAMASDSSAPGATDAPGTSPAANAGAISLPADRVNPAAVGRKIKGVVFDMDGTLTVPCIDFAEMRRRVGVHPTKGDILKIIHEWDEARQKEAFRVIAEIEEQALRDMKIMAGAVELCKELDDRNMPRAIVTRNVMSSVDFFHDTHFPLPPFHPSLSREWQPYKPDPASLHYIASQWKVDSSELVMIGDSCRDDIGAGSNAGATTILIDEDKKWTGIDDERLPVRPDFIVHDLFEARSVLHELVEMVGGAGGGVDA